MRRRSGGRARVPPRRTRYSRAAADTAPSSRRVVRDPACLRAPAACSAAAPVRAPRQTPHGARDQCRRDLDHGPGHTLRNRPRARAHQPLRKARQRAAPARRADFPGIRGSAHGALRAYGAGGVCAVVQRGGLPGAARVHRAGNPTHQSGRGAAIHAGTRHP